MILGYLLGKGKAVPLVHYNLLFDVRMKYSTPDSDWPDREYVYRAIQADTTDRTPFLNNSPKLLWAPATPGVLVAYLPRTHASMVGVHSYTKSRKRYQGVVEWLDFLHPHYLPALTADYAQLLATADSLDERKEGSGNTLRQVGTLLKDWSIPPLSLSADWTTGYSAP